ncbi:MAG: translocation/assembly module TamB domain-containing protein [Alloprevotella sp.]
MSFQPRRHSFRKFLQWTTAVLLLAYTLLLAVLNLTTCRNWIASTAAELLGNTLKTEVSIGDVQVDLFNRVILHDVKVKDQKGEWLLQAGMVSCKIELRSLVKERLVIRTFSLLDTDVNLYKESANAAPNFQFVLDAFKSSDDSPSKPLNLSVRSLIMRRVSLRYDARHLPRRPSGLDVNHLSLNDLDANVSLRVLRPDSMNLRVRHFAVSEKSGLRLDHLSFILEGNARSARLVNLQCRLPRSSVSAEELTAAFDSRSARPLATLSTSRFKTDLNLDTRDFAFLGVEALNRVPHLLSLQSALECRRGKLTAEGLHLSVDGDETLWAAAREGHYAWDGAEKGDCGVTDLQLFAARGSLAELTRGIVADSTLCGVLKRVGEVQLNATAAYRLPTDRGSLRATLRTDCGEADVQATADNGRLQGVVSARDVALSSLLASETLPTMFSARAEVSSTLQHGAVLAARSSVSVPQVQWRGNDLKDISLNLDYQHAASLRHALRASLSSLDEQARGDVEGKVEWGGGKLLSGNVQGEIQNLQLQLLGMPAAWQRASVGGKLTAELLSPGQRGQRADIHLSDVTLKEGPHGNASLQDLTLLLQPSAEGEDLRLRSDFLDADLQGNLSPTRLVAALKEKWQCILADTVSHRSVSQSNSAQTRLAAASENFQTTGGRLHWKSADILNTLFGTDIALAQNGVDVQLLLSDDARRRSSLTVGTDSFRIGSNSFGRTGCYISGSGGNYDLFCQTVRNISGRPFRLEAQLDTRDGELPAKLSWKALESATRKYEGSLAATLRALPRAGGKMDYRVSIQPTSFFLADSLWQVASGNLLIAGKEIDLQHVGIASGQRSLTVDGRLSPHGTDSVVANLKDVEVAYILDLVNFDDVSFAGSATGRVVLAGTTEDPRIEARLFVPDFLFNDCYMGRSRINGRWEAPTGRLFLDADMRLTEDGKQGTELTGYVGIKEKALALDMKAKKTDLRFLCRYVDGIFEDFQGNATGDVKLYGPFKGLDLGGQVTADVAARIPVTGVTYKLRNGTLKMEPGAFLFDRFAMDDGRGGKGEVTGALRHTHLKNLRYDFRVEANRLLCYDRQKDDEMPFQCRAVGSGNVHIMGLPGYLQTDINLRPESPTTFVYTLTDSGDAGENADAFRFHDAEEKMKAAEFSETPVTFTPREAAPSGTEIVLNLLIDANPSAEFKVITDSRSGDAITAYGEGPIRVNFNNRSGFEMYGTYHIVRGTYKFSVQDIIRKDLTLQPGSTLAFTGIPSEGRLNLKAYYTVNGARLSDLNYGAGFSDKNVKVNTVLNIGGQVKAPQVSFDLDLSGISEDEKQMVLRLISTEEDMNRQALYLLGVGRFYTTNTGGIENGSDNAGRGQSAAAMRSFLSTTLSAQLNNAISEMLGTQSHWTFGTNFSPGTMGWSDMEVDGLLQGRLLNDRLLINGNFGYRERTTYGSNFVGDFDVRYLLTPKGNISLKAYSETTDRYFTRTSLTTQGVGIALQKDFNRWSELFKRKSGKKK